MEKLSLTGSDGEVQQWKEEADELGITHSRYAKERIRAGKSLWDMGEFQPEALAQLSSENETQYDRTQKTSSPQTIEQDLTESILRELPKADARDPVKLAELQQLIFGSEEEQKNAILNALEILHKKGKAEQTIKGGYVKNDEE